MIAVGVVVAVFVGMALQRITGVGFALVVAPFLVVLLGPVDGALLVNLTGALASLALLVARRREVRWRRVAVLVPPALVGIATGLVVAHFTSVAALQVGIGALVLVALTAVLLAPRWRIADRPRSLAVAGYVSGTMNALAGLGGPAVTVYAAMTRWPIASFAATMQAYFAAAASVSFLAKFALTGGRLPPLPPVVWIGIAVVAPLGILLGGFLASRLSPRSVRVLLFVLAYAGGLAALGTGLALLVG